MLTFFWHIEKTHDSWSWVNFMGILLSVENNSVQRRNIDARGIFPKLITQLLTVWRVLADRTIVTYENQERKCISDRSTNNKELK